MSTKNENKRLLNSINKDWRAAVESMTDEDRRALVKEMQASPAMILETQQRVLALCMEALDMGDMTAAGKFRSAAYGLSAFAVACRIAGLTDKEEGQ